MRVLILTQLFPPEPDLKALPLARELRARGHSVEVLTGFPNYPGGEVYDGYRVRPWQRDEVDGVPVYRVALYPSHDRRALHRALNYMSFAVSAAGLAPWLVERPDVVYVYNLITLAPAAGLLRRLKGAKVVLDVQDLWPESVTSSGMVHNPSWLRMLRRWSDASYSKADHLFVLSPGFRNRLLQRGVAEERIEVIYNWTIEDSGRLTNDERAPSARTEFRVVFAGTMGIMQSLDVVIEAARLLLDSAPDVRFVLLGSGVDRDRLRIAASGLSNVEFMPRCPRAEADVILASADALLVHLKNDPLFEITIPSKIQAYLFAGKPILCGVRGDAANLVTTAGAGITFAPEDASDLSRAVLALRALPDDRLRDMGVAGRRYYDTHLSLSRGVDRMEAAFQRLVRA